MPLAQLLREWAAPNAPSPAPQRAGCPQHPHPNPSGRQAALASNEASLTALPAGTWKSPWIFSQRWTSWCS